ncbi:hypothetical protein B0H11DRAFT_2189605 [Mycena galericulata]|nr:hypothetical protein B0H11DRAFT_2189605 [Mycena galericulata]
MEPSVHQRQLFAHSLIVPLFLEISTPLRYLPASSPLPPVPASELVLSSVYEFLKHSATTTGELLICLVLLLSFHNTRSSSTIEYLCLDHYVHFSAHSPFEDSENTAGRKQGRRHEYTHHIFIILDAYSAATAFPTRYALPSSSPRDKPRRNYASSPSYVPVPPFPCLSLGAPIVFSPLWAQRLYHNGIALSLLPGTPYPITFREPSAEADLRPRRLYRSFTAVALAIRSPTERWLLSFIRSVFHRSLYSTTDITTDIKIPHGSRSKASRLEIESISLPSEQGCVPKWIRRRSRARIKQRIALTRNNVRHDTVHKIINQSPRDIDAQYVLRSGPTL